MSHQYLQKRFPCCPPFASRLHPFFGRRIGPPDLILLIQTSTHTMKHRPSPSPVVSTSLFTIKAVNVSVSIPLPSYLTGHVGQDYILDMVHVTFEEHGALRCPEINASKPPTSSIRATFIRDDRLKLPCRARISPRFRFPYGLATNEDLHEVWKAEYLDEADDPSTSRSCGNETADVSFRRT